MWDAITEPTRAERLSILLEEYLDIVKNKYGLDRKNLKKMVLLKDDPA